MKIAVTGGSGIAGSFVIPELVENGHEVVNVDTVAGPKPDAPFLRADLTDYGQTVSSLHRAEGVVHLAAIPNPLNDPDEVVFSTNVMSTWNVLQAAEVLGIEKLVLASSINAVGAVFSHESVPPLYFPLDEDHPTRAEDSYSLSKWVGEQIADGFARKRRVQIASMRFHGLRNDAEIAQLRSNPVSEPLSKASQFWGYVHLRDAARACRLALEADWEGHEAFFINASDTTLSAPTEDALEASYPGVELKRSLPGFSAVIDCSKAKRFFSWEPAISWREG